MKLINPCNEAFVPLLEDYFIESIYVPITSESKILKYHRLLHEKQKNIISRDKNICIGVDAYDSSVDYLFVWQVSDVIKLVTNTGLISMDRVKIICNLETHFHELIAAGYIVESVYQKLGRNLPIINFKDPDFAMLTKSRSSVMINPTSKSNEDIFNCIAFIKFRENAFEPSDDNYSNEFCEVYQMATIIGVEVYTTTSKEEVNSIMDQIKKGI